MSEKFPTSEEILKEIKLPALLSNIEQFGELPDLSSDQLDTLYENMTQEDILSYYTHVLDIEDEQKRKEVLNVWIPKPKKLFHVSKSGDIEKFEPREEKKRNEDEPAQVFGAPSKKIASMFFVDKSYMISRSYDNGRTWSVIIGDEEQFKKDDKGGYLYTLSPNNFEVNPDRGLGLFEWTSTKEETFLNKEHFPSGLDAMLTNGVKVYMVKKETFDRFNADEEDHIAILKELEPLERKND
jgi:hypothetical protein